LFSTSNYRIIQVVKSIKIKILLFCFIILLGVFKTPNTSLAISNLGIGESNINIEITPENPEPNQDITIKLSSYAIDINKSMIVWKNNKNTVLSGYGKTSYSFRTSNDGLSSIFDISITPTGGVESISKRIAIVPSEVSLLWESNDGYTPPFYKGKSFATPESSIKVVAIPKSTSIKSKTGSIVYDWRLNDNAMTNVSGYNKDSFVFINKTMNDTENVTVSVSSVSGQYNAKKTISIPITKPKIIFYKKSPLEGILYNNGYVGEIDSLGEETTIVAEPYFLSYKNKEGDFNYTWKINNEKIKNPTKKTELTVRPTSKGGFANISLQIESLSRLFQNVLSKVKINL